MCISTFRYGKHPNIISLLYSELQIRNLHDVNNNTWYRIVLSTVYTKNSITLVLLYIM